MQETSFAELGLRPELLRAVTEAGYVTPTPIQAQAIPIILAGKDVMGGAQTGTGKTAGFALPILQKLAPSANTSPSPARHPVRALILTPTRELAVQVEESIRTYSKYLNLRSTVVFGGVDIKQQLPIVRGGVEILVATPGRLLDHVEQKSVYLGQVEIFVLDEADRMLDMGFIPDIRRIMALLPVTAKRQNLLFSATFSGEIKKLADQLLNAPQLIEVTKRNTAAETVVQTAYKVPSEGKRALLEHLVRSGRMTQVLCFMRTKHSVSRLARQLSKDGLTAESIHGDKSQQARMEALAAFKEGKLQVLVATDVAARGLDIDSLPHVLNYELPHVPEDYIHRIGRTGRAGASGEAISFVAPDEEKYLADIEKLLKKRVPIVSLDGVELVGAKSKEPRRTTREPGESAETKSRTRERVPREPSLAAPSSPQVARGTRRSSAEPVDASRVDEASRGNGSDRRKRSNGDTRRDGRDRGPASSREYSPAAMPPDATAADHGPSMRRPALHKPRPIPALLMKRPAKEPEKV